MLECRGGGRWGTSEGDFAGATPGRAEGGGRPVWWQRARAGWGHRPSVQGPSLPFWPRLSDAPGRFSPFLSSLWLPLAAQRVRPKSGKQVDENADSLVSSPRSETGNAGPRSGWAPGARARLGAPPRRACSPGQRKVPAGGCAERGGRGGQRGMRWRWLGSTCQRREGRAGKRGSRKRVAAAAGPLERRERRRREEGARRREAGRKEGARQAGGGRAD